MGCSRHSITHCSKINWQFAGAEKPTTNLKCCVTSKGNILSREPTNVVPSAPGVVLTFPIWPTFSVGHHQKPSHTQLSPGSKPDLTLTNENSSHPMMRAVSGSVKEPVSPSNCVSQQHFDLQLTDRCSSGIQRAIGSDTKAIPFTCICWGLRASYTCARCKQIPFARDWARYCVTYCRKHYVHISQRHAISAFKKKDLTLFSKLDCVF